MSEATAWFEDVYAAAADGRGEIPWARREPNPYLVDWARRRAPADTERLAAAGTGRRAVVVGSGLGDDAEYVAGLGFDTVAFDIAPSAVQAARERFPDTPVEYVVADLLDPPPEWRRAFDLVVEISTVQALPEPVRGAATVQIGQFVAAGGTLVVIARGRPDGVEVSDGPPWPLTRAEIDRFAVDGLRVVRVDYLPDEDGAEIGRWIAELTR